jgi:hypothetical protein
MGVICAGKTPLNPAMFVLLLTLEFHNVGRSCSRRPAAIGLSGLCTSYLLAAIES